MGRHRVSACSLRHHCRKCQRKHHTSLCSDTDSPKETTTKQPTTIISTSTPSSSSTTQPVATSGQYHVASGGVCLLKTAVATVSSHGTSVDANILFDEGSQRSFVSKGLADCLQVKPHKTEILSISTFGTQVSHTSQFETTVILLHGTAGQLIPLTVLIVPTIAAPIHNVNQNSISNLPYLAELRLAHPVSSSEQSTISLLIGADHYWDVVEDHIVRGNGPTAMRSKLGYLLSGPMSVVTPQSNSTAFHVSAQQPTSEPDLQQFWSMESLGISPTKESPNTFIEQYKANSIEQLPDGSYSARFPWKENHPPLPSNFQHASIVSEHWLISYHKLPICSPNIKRLSQIRKTVALQRRFTLQQMIIDATTFHTIELGRTR